MYALGAGKYYFDEKDVEFNKKRIFLTILAH